MLGRRRQRPVRPTGTYTDWHWPPAGDGYRSFEWALTPHTDPSPDGYFWSHQFWLLGGEAGYAGLQTRGSDPTGKIAIFSVWGALAADGPAVAGAFAGEGTGQTARIPYPWEVGSTYRLRVTATGAGEWEGWVGDLASGREELIGRIAVPGTWGTLNEVSVVWTERYAGDLSSCADIRRSVVTFATPTADGGEVMPRWHRNHLAQPPGCPGSSVTDVAGGVAHVMGADQPAP